jgi:hypothetical protein
MWHVKLIDFNTFDRNTDNGIPTVTVDMLKKYMLVVEVEGFYGYGMFH